MHTRNPCELLTALTAVGSGGLLGCWLLFGRFTPGYLSLRLLYFRCKLVNFLELRQLDIKLLQLRVFYGYLRIKLGYLFCKDFVRDWWCVHIFMCAKKSNARKQPNH